MDAIRLRDHIERCLRGLTGDEQNACANCPWEADIVSAYPEMELVFKMKRKRIAQLERAAEKPLCPVCGRIYMEPDAHFGRPRCPLCGWLPPTASSLMLGLEKESP
jgi:hypothetical protein